MLKGIISVENHVYFFREKFYYKWHRKHIVMLLFLDKE